MAEKKIKVHVAVPADRESDFYDAFYPWFDAWRRGEQQAGVVSHGGGGGDGVLEKAVTWWRSLTPNERGLWGLLAEAAPGFVSEQEIVERLGLPKGAASLRGTLSHVYGKADKAGFATNWDRMSDDETRQTSYRLFVKKDQLKKLGVSLTLDEYTDLVLRARAQAESEEGDESAGRTPGA